MDLYDALNLIITLGSIAILIAAAFGLSYWAFASGRYRAARTGLYVVLGFVAFIFLLAGFAGLLTGRGSGNLVLLSIGLGLGLPLLPPVRRVVALVTPMDPNSPVDMVGLCLVLTVILFSAATQGTVADMLISGSGDELVASFSIPVLILQNLVFLILAYIAVGFWFVRSLRAATARLGIVPPTLPAARLEMGYLVSVLAYLGVAAAFFVAAFVFIIVAGNIASIVQPSVSSGMEEIVQEMTASVQSPIGAVVLGVSAGIGEEAIFRGALQPRFGIVLTSIAFTMIHAPQYGINLILLGLFGVSVLLGLERRYFGTTAAMVTHALFNTIQALMLLLTSQ